jgi:hypothetical protein
MMRVAGTAALVALAARSVAAVKIEAMKHDVQQITQGNFDGVIGKFREGSVSALWFFKGDNADDDKFLDPYNELAKEMKGMVKITAIDCNENSKFCEKNNVKTTPSVMIYPPNPMPAFMWEGKMEKKALSGRLGKLVPDMSTVLTGETIDKFLTTDPTKPKVMLFSNKDKVPLIFKALSSEQVLRRTIKFGFVKEAESAIVSRFKVKKFPTLISVSGAKADTREEYKGDITFAAVHEWVNLRSESGMGDKVHGGGGAGAEESIEEAKPWLVQEVPELTSKSHKDICFKGEGLCVIYLKDGPISGPETDFLTGLSKKFTSQLSDRGTKMKWMWMDLKIETAYKELFAPEQLPSAVVFNPHKRLRFTKLEHGEDGEIKGDEQGLSNLMEKVLGGDARFKMVPGQKLPGWATRKDDDKKKTEL